MFAYETQNLMIKFSFEGKRELRIVLLITATEEKIPNIYKHFQADRKIVKIMIFSHIKSLTALSRKETRQNLSIFLIKLSFNHNETKPVNISQKQ